MGIDFHGYLNVLGGVQMIRLYLLRHGETKWNRLAKTQGCMDTDLSEAGLVQAEKLAQRLVSEGINVIYSSNLKRACITAQIIGDVLNAPIDIQPDLREMNFGRWEGMNIHDIKEEYFDIYRLWLSNPKKARIPDAEGLKQVQNRAMEVINGIIALHKGDNIAIVSHGVTLKCLVLGVLGIDLSNMSKIRIDNCSISQLILQKEQCILNYLNDTCHLGG